VAVPAGSTGLAIESNRVGDDHVIALGGELELATVPAVEAALQRVEAGDCRRILFDLSRIEFVDSTGIHLLMGLHQRCEARGRSLAVVAPSGPARRVLELSGALAILEPEEIAA
jgi:anti-sigma B factor antagonist